MAWADVYVKRPAKLATDTAAMIDVVKHVLSEIPGPDDQIIVLLQPTQPLRKPEHVREAIRLLQTPPQGCRPQLPDSVVSVKALPPTHCPEVALQILPDGQLEPWCQWVSLPTRRQDIEPSYIRDGTVYAFYRRTVSEYGSIYGDDVCPLIISPEDTCELDTQADWDALERRLRA